jgi:imidazolonepropionase
MTASARFTPAALAGGAPIDFLVTDIAQLCTVDNPDLDAKGPRRREGMTDAGLVTDAVLAVGDGRIQGYGPRSEVLGRLFADGRIPAGVPTVDAGGRAVVPGFVDPHTHAVFGRTRQDEYERRIRGETYLQIAAAGGGIHASVADLRERSEEELVELTVPRLQEMLAHGTTTVEIKSGYGLSLDDELKMLRAARTAADRVGIGSVLTCLAAHEIPREYREKRQDYVRLITEEILVAVARGGLAERCDVFCEPSVFGLEESLVILSRARDLGLALTVHADELESFGGAVLAARLGAASADHLIRIDAEGIRALAGSQTVAVMLPGTVFTLGLDHYAPGRGMIEQGCALALASDFNPGSSPILSIPLIMSIACSQMRLLPAECLVAATLNAAWALGRQDEVGSLSPGKWADFLILDDNDYRVIPYRAGHNPVRSTFVKGHEISP